MKNASKLDCVRERAVVACFTVSLRFSLPFLSFLLFVDGDGDDKK